MNYISGFMMGASIGKAVHNMFFGGGNQQIPKQKIKMNQIPRLSQGQNRNLVNKPLYAKVTPPFKCIFKIPGRRRWHISNLTNEVGIALMVQINRLTYVTKFRYNVLTGNVLICYDPKEEDRVDEIEATLTTRFFEEAVEETAWKGKAELDKANVPVLRSGTLTQSVQRSVFDFNNFIRKQTGGCIDLNSALSIVFIISGIRKFILMREFPSGYQMVWWAMTLMRGWKNT